MCGIKLKRSLQLRRNPPLLLAKSPAKCAKSKLICDVECYVKAPAMEVTDKKCWSFSKQFLFVISQMHLWKMDDFGSSATSWFNLIHGLGMGFVNCEVSTLLLNDHKSGERFIFKNLIAFVAWVHCNNPNLHSNHVKPRSLEGWKRNI